MHVVVSSYPNPDSHDEAMTLVRVLTLEVKREWSTRFFVSAHLSGDAMSAMPKLPIWLSN